MQGLRTQELEQRARFSSGVRLRDPPGSPNHYCQTPWRAVVLLQPDGAVTVVQLGAADVQVTRGSITTDGDGPRQATGACRDAFGIGVWKAVNAPDGFRYVPTRRVSRAEVDDMIRRVEEARRSRRTDNDAASAFCSALTLLTERYRLSRCAVLKVIVTQPNDIRVRRQRPDQLYRSEWQ